MTGTPVETLRALFRSLPAAAVMLDADGRIAVANPAAARLFGLERAEMGGRSGQSLFARPREFDRRLAADFDLAADRSEARFVTSYRTRGGRVFEGETVASRVATPSGTPLGTLLIVRDVTGELSLKARLEASDIQLRAALASANEGTFSLNLVTRLGSVRGFVTEFLGIESSDATISLERWLEVIEPDMRTGVEATIRGMSDDPKLPLDSVFRARRADDEWRWLHMRGRVTEFGRDGRPLRISGVISDVTDRQVLEHQLADRERQLANAIDAGSCGVWELDPETKQVTPIGPVRAMLGLSGENDSIDAQVWLASTHEDDREAVSAQIAALVSGETDAVDMEYRLLDSRTGQWLWLRSRGKRVVDGHGRRLTAGILTDISERKQLEARLEDNERLLREALESANDGAWSLDVERETLRATGFLARLLGVENPDETVPSGRWADAMDPDDIDRERVTYDRLRTTQRPESGESPQLSAEFRMHDPDGGIVWVRTRGRIVEWNQDGMPKRIAGTVANITEERRLKAALESSETRLREALQAAKEGAWRFNLVNGIADVTSVIAEMMGLPPRDVRISYSDWLERVHPDDRHVCHDCVEALLSGRDETVDYMVRYRSEIGGWIRIHNRGRVSERDEDGRPVAATGFLTDVTDRILAQEALHQRDQQLSAAVDAASIGTWRHDYASDCVTFRGSLVAELFGRGTETTLPIREWHGRVHPDDLVELKQVSAEALGGEIVTADYEYRLKNHRGEWVWYRNIGSVVEWGPDGEPQAASGVIWNIQAAKAVETELEEKRERFERIYRATPAMMHTIDADGVIVEVSDFWLAYLGYERHEVVGHKSIDFLDAESRRRAVEISLPELFATGRNTAVPYRFLRKNGTGIDVLLSSFLERDNEGRPLRSYAVMTDVTPLREANELLERSNKELDRFATVASHDLQEPLRKIAAFAGIVRRRYTDKLDESGVSQLDFLVDAAHRMQRLINDLLTYSKLASQPVTAVRVDLGAALARALEHLETAIEESGATVRAEDLPVVDADETLLIQILQNLLGNAVKYRSGLPPDIVVEARRDEAVWTISVTDNGIGLDTRFAEKIFAPFQRLHSREAYKGTGIGLAIVRQAVERQGGRVWVESQPGEGAAFFFTLPARDGDARIRPDPANQAAK